ncbi:hypothetical protein DOY81_012096, partial [Sarcophaga bullata]
VSEYFVNLKEMHVNRRRWQQQTGKQIKKTRCRGRRMEESNGIYN